MKKILALLLFVSTSISCRDPEIVARALRRDIHRLYTYIAHGIQPVVEFTGDMLDKATATPVGQMVCDFYDENPATAQLIAGGVVSLSVIYMMYNCWCPGSKRPKANPSIQNASYFTQGERVTNT